MRGFEEDQPPIYYSSESESEMFMVVFAVAVMQNIRVDKNYRFKFSQRQKGVNDRCVFHIFFDLS